MSHRQHNIQPRRPPTDEEHGSPVEFLSASDRPTAQLVQELVWTLIYSSEFRFNH